MDVLSVEAVAEKLGCSRRRVFQLLAEGVLDRAPRFGRRLRIYAASVDRALTPKAPRARRRQRGPAWSVDDIRPDLLG